MDGMNPLHELHSRFSVKGCEDRVLFFKVEADVKIIHFSQLIVWGKRG